MLFWGGKRAWDPRASPASAAAEKGPPALESTEGRKNKEGEIQSREKCCLTIPHSSFAASGMENRAELISTWL